jgi:hypothetical protein
LIPDGLVEPDEPVNDPEILAGAVIAPEPFRCGNEPHPRFSGDPDEACAALFAVGHEGCIAIGSARACQDAMRESGADKAIQDRGIHTSAVFFGIADLRADYKTAHR